MRRPSGPNIFRARSDPIAKVAAEIGNIDLVYEATGASQFAFQVLPFLGSNGIFVFTGVPGKDQDVDLDTGTIMKNLVLKNQIVLGTVNAGPDAFQAAIRDLAVFYQRWPDVGAGADHRPLSHRGVRRTGVRHTGAASRM